MKGKDGETKRMRLVDTNEYVSTLKELTEEGKEVSMQISGGSMEPFLVHARDSIRFRKPDRPLKKGDMVFYQRAGGQYVMHRIIRVKPDGYWMIGDAQTEKEGPIQREQIFALITGVRRRGKWIGPGDFWWEFFSHVWTHLIPVRRLLINGYVTCGRFLKRRT